MNDRDYTSMNNNWPEDREAQGFNRPAASSSG